ncbi:MULTISPECIES: hypothetical protein [unclassified Streptomyces]|uniref:hypothetical protein n=1 Tax=unclassified Streptomyces TaxID=2593676 RepID=UPI000F4D33F7|nr:MULTISPECIES: hypothetical protein [unclassified Streptomyces]MDH6456020.1 FtsH-binding integral membrane protein [Streptomyces sp. SAI-119]MDH6502052.1 FtsH-binding integral membrane protein [Streptomyces sp. SAI-149]QUC59564.1 hypothetical protein IOD14_23995 [Streptomyces sp. A2-16]
MTHTDDPTAARAARQLRRIRSFYAAGVALWTATSVWTMWDAPGSRPMWISVLLLAVFTGLLAMTCRWLRRVEPTGSARPARHVALSHRAGRHALSKP